MWLREASIWCLWADPKSVWTFWLKEEMGSAFPAVAPPQTTKSYSQQACFFICEPACSQVFTTMKSHSRDANLRIIRSRIPPTRSNSSKKLRQFPPSRKNARLQAERTATLYCTLIIGMHRTSQTTESNATASDGGTHSIAPASYGLTRKIAAVHPKLISNYSACEMILQVCVFFSPCKN